MLDFVAIGDTTVDEFIKLKEARVTCDVSDEDCTITLKWGDKIPFESATTVAGVGNAANAAVAAARLGLSVGFVSNIGADPYGREILQVMKTERVDTSHITVHTDIPTNHHYVLWYESERSILIRHEHYPYRMPEQFAAPSWLYLSSLGDNSEAFHEELLAWLLAHPDTKLAFQPGTFQMKMGREKLGGLYERTDFFSCNKEEAERILGLPETGIAELLPKMRELGPKVVLITNGPDGAYAHDGEKMLRVPSYPDPKPPYERTGAGDAMSSTVVAALALGKPLAEALLWGPINAMSVVGDIGAQRGLLRQKDILEQLRNAPSSYRVTQL